MNSMNSTFSFDATKIHSGPSLVVGSQGRASDPGGSRLRVCLVPWILVHFYVFYVLTFQAHLLYFPCDPPGIINGSE